MNKHRLFMAMGWVTLLGFPAIGLSVLYFVSGDWQHIFREGWPVYYQLLLGLVVGLAMGYGLRALLGIKPLREANAKYSSLLADFELKRPDWIFISVCAGVGEEILFRGCVQEYAGVWLTSLAFVALHGYINPTDWKVSIYGLTLFVLFAGVGYLRVYTGIYTCILVHIVVDILLFDHLLLSMKNKN